MAVPSVEKASGSMLPSRWRVRRRPAAARVIVVRVRGPGGGPRAARPMETALIRGGPSTARSSIRVPVPAW
ncbi:hypothetical protein AB0J35_61305 [Nonomuraea angiospora]|uniref:hypothetical protein n=1 Tax=Nonomuraea angiospora TaxID=46172 RepID=UPI0034313151